MKAIRAAVGSILLAVPLAAAQQTTALANGPQGNSAQNTAKPLTFDVISVKPNHSDSADAQMGMNRDGFTAANIDLHLLLLQAFELQEGDQLLGEPKWTTGGRWDIDARIAAEDIPALAKMTYHERNGMFREILVERFAEGPPRDPYAAGVCAGGGEGWPEGDGFQAPAKRSRRHAGQPGSAEHEPGKRDGPRSPDRVPGRRSVRRVGPQGGGQNRPDRTLRLYADVGSDDDAAAMGSSASCGAPQGPSLFTAVQEQLGLKLELVKAPVDVVVIDHLEKPSEN
jgi:hypothetical protein